MLFKSNNNINGEFYYEVFVCGEKKLRKFNHLVQAVIRLEEIPAPYYQKHALLKDFSQLIQLL
jgi:hypothetical protein